VPRKESPRPSSKEASSVFKKLEPQLRDGTKVPLRLPAVLPYLDAEHPVFANLSSVDESHYEIYLGWTSDCAGENVCSYGRLYGGGSPFQSPQEEAAKDDNERREKLTLEPVELRRGIKGQFIDAVCHAYCTESYIRWCEGRFCYAIGMKVGSKEMLVKVVNSAIPVRRSTETKR